MQRSLFYFGHTYMTRFYKLLYAVLLVVICGIVVVSCRKKLPKCANNCVPITISGSIYDKTNGAPFSNVPVSAVFYLNGSCPGSGCGTSYEVASGVSKPDGSFSLAATIDTSFFTDYHLTVSIPQDSNYICISDYIGSNIAGFAIYDFTPAAFQNINFEFYPKTTLTLRIHRTQTDSWQLFLVDHHFKSQINHGGIVNIIQIGLSHLSITGHQNAVDSFITFRSVADTYSKINWVKKTNSIILQEFNDSLKCTRTGPNIYDIYY
ncbi:MAG: hypothetical protein ACHQFX_01130 [Chitinophagales bacterium]